MCGVTTTSRRRYVCCSHEEAFIVNGGLGSHGEIKTPPDLIRKTSVSNKEKQRLDGEAAVVVTGRQEHTTMSIAVGKSAFDFGTTK
jgi:hypothetical protein